jgi:hypothetical protein
MKYPTKVTIREGMLRSILHKEASGRSATRLEIDHCGCSQNTGGRVWLRDEKRSISITFYDTDAGLVVQD